MLEKGPWTLNTSGEWTPVRSLSLRAWSLYLAHHTLAALTQKAWLWEKGRPGRRGSTPFLDSQDSANKNSQSLIAGGSWDSLYAL